MQDPSKRPIIDIGDRLRALGRLGDDPSPDAVKVYLANARAFVHDLDDGDRELLRSMLVKELKAAGVQAPARVVDAYFAPHRQDTEPEEPRQQVEPEELLEAGREILEAEDQLAHFRGSLRRRGYAGSTEAAEILYVALHSRSLSRPINVGLQGPSAAGKTHIVEQVLLYHPPEAYHDLTASSERALAYSNFRSEHAYVLISESSALHRDGVGATIIRGLAWGNGIRYETVQKGADGLEAILIEKPGPTGLITTSTKPLDPEISTRLLQVHVTDAPEQTKAVVKEEGDKAAGLVRESDEDLLPCIQASRWLEVAGCREVVVLYAPELARLVPTDDVRMRRDFTQILTVIGTLAFMHQRHRERDAQGRVVASRRDYENAYRLLAEVLAVTLDSVTDATRETVAAVEELTGGTVGGVSYLTLAERLGMSRSGAWRRGQTALRDGFLINVEDRQGYPARLKLGDPLPPGRSILPSPDELFSADHLKNDATAQHMGAKAPNGAANTVARGVDSPELLSQRLEARNSSRNGPFPRGSAAKPGGVEPLSAKQGGNERGLLNADVDRAWDAAWALDDRHGDHAATAYVAATILDGNLDSIAALADELEAQVRQEQMVP